MHSFGCNINTIALLTTRRRALQRITTSPSRIDNITAAVRILTEFGQRDLRVLIWQVAECPADEE